MRFALLASLVFGLAPPVLAHPLAPSVLEMRETVGGQAEVGWKEGPAGAPAGRGARAGPSGALSHGGGRAKVGFVLTPTASVAAAACWAAVKPRTLTGTRD